MSAHLVGVGVGPGDPDLITVKARDVLCAADVVLVPVSRDAPDDEPGYAERIVRAHVPHATEVLRLPFAVTDDQAARDASWHAAAERVVEVLDDRYTVAFATIGDPHVYSTFIHLVREVRALRPNLEVSTVPGITAMQDLAARSGTVLVEREEALTLLPFTAGESAVRQALRSNASLVLYKGGRLLPEIRRVLAEEGVEHRAVLGARLGLHDEEVVGADAGHHLPDRPAPYLSTIIVPPERPT